MSRPANGATVDDLARFHARYPSIGFHIAMCDDGMGDLLPCLVFVHNDTEIMNPLFCEGYASDVDPVIEYGILQQDAEEIASINGC
ncbi:MULTISPECIES: hypothetical protein [Cupriavidus]|uniref:hypothetical protein n=1 Tax=Cupriavidus TaxID=106589 RepID=UPI000B22A4A4|nr:MULTISPECIES: hypothetical protein [Cupriavidus]QGS27387.1 hypothetical protein FOB83_00080 [Cupriavidus metallidurans]